MDNQTSSAIQEFSEYLLSTVPEFQELYQARQQVNNDPVAKKIWSDKEEIQETIEFMKKNGLPISTEQQQNLAQKLKDMRENPLTMRYLKAINYAVKISGKIGAQLEEIIGVNFASKNGC